MIAGQFDVVFRGQLVKSFELEQVKDNLVQLFKSSPEAVDKLFTGKEVSIKKSLDYATAMKYQSALKKAGALALIKEIEVESNTVLDQAANNLSDTKPARAQFGTTAASFTDATPKATSASAQATAQPSNNAKAEQAIVAQPSSITASPNPTNDELASEKIIETAPPSQAESPSEAAEPFTVAEVGASILPDKIYEKRDVDTSALSLAEAGERIMPDIPKDEPAAPSVEHLSLVDNEID
ncbi:MAG: hypothetical protein Q9M92_11475 [Enterobacterales bacterium]|nr:hypothetical protein [Enterobacterales bacterium]